MAISFLAADKQLAYVAIEQIAKLFYRLKVDACGFVIVEI
jgi:hypothetical protein